MSQSLVVACCFKMETLRAEHTGLIKEATELDVPPLPSARERLLNAPPSNDGIEQGQPDGVSLTANNNDTRSQFPLRKASLIITCIVAATVALWVFSGATYARYMPNKVPLLVLAWTFGLRHGLDADHIAAIDNVTRRLVQDGHAFVTVGTYFSLGHSTIVIIATLLIAAVSASISAGFSNYQNVSGTIGSSISASFLLIIAAINGVSLFLIARDLRRERNRADAAAESKAAASVVAAAICGGGVGVDGGGVGDDSGDGSGGGAHAGAPNSPRPTADEVGSANGPKPTAVKDEANDVDWAKILENAGFFTRLFGKRLFRLIDRPFKMYFVGTCTPSSRVPCPTK